MQCDLVMSYYYPHCSIRNEKWSRATNQHLHQSSLQRLEIVIVPTSSHQVFEERPFEIAQEMLNFISTSLN